MNNETIHLEKVAEEGQNVFYDLYYEGRKIAERITLAEFEAALEHLYELESQP